MDFWSNESKFKSCLFASIFFETPKICQKKTNDTPLLHRRHCDYCCCEESTMSKPFDYSKWDNIELSDDEDDVHPNEAEEADKKKIHQAVR